MPNSTPGSSSSSSLLGSVPSGPGVAFWLAVSWSGCPACGPGSPLGACALPGACGSSGACELPGASGSSGACELPGAGELAGGELASGGRPHGSGDLRGGGTLWEVPGDGRPAGRSDGKPRGARGDRGPDPEGPAPLEAPGGPDGSAELASSAGRVMPAGAGGTDPLPELPSLVYAGPPRISCSLGGFMP